MERHDQDAQRSMQVATELDTAASEMAEHKVEHELVELVTPDTV